MMRLSTGIIWLFLRNAKEMNIEQLIIKTFESFNPIKIIIFGSYARNEQDEHSDIDIIVVYDTNKKFLDRLKELYMEWNIPKAVDILAYTPEEYERMLKQSAFVYDAVTQGKIIYERKYE